MDIVKTDQVKTPELIPTPEPEAKTPESKAKTPKTMGVVYVAVGDSYIKELIKSARSFKKYMPKIPITAHASRPAMLHRHRNLFQHIHKIDVSPIKKGEYTTDPYAKFNKVKIMNTFPYDLTLYLDVDTEIRGDLRPLFRVLDQNKENIQYDLAMANSPLLDKSVRPYRMAKYVRPTMYNSGVVLYKKNQAMKNLFGRWLKRCEQVLSTKKARHRKLCDQSQLAILLNEKPSRPVKLKIVPNKVYNARHTMLPRIKKDGIYHKVKIVHKH